METLNKSNLEKDKKIKELINIKENLVVTLKNYECAENEKDGG